MEGSLLCNGSNCRQNTEVNYTGWEHVNTHKIYKRIKLSCFFFKHYITPVLVLKAFKIVNPVGSKTQSPEKNCSKKKTAQKRIISINLCKGKTKNHRRLHAPIWVVNRGISEYQAEDKYYNSCKKVCQKKG